MNHVKQKTASSAAFDTTNVVVDLIHDGFMHGVSSANHLPGIVHGDKDAGIYFTYAFEQAVQVFAFHNGTYDAQWTGLSIALKLRHAIASRTDDPGDFIVSGE